MSQITPEDVDEHHRVRLVGQRQRVDDLGDGLVACLLELVDEIARLGRRRIRFGDQLGQHLVGTKRGEKTHPCVPAPAARASDFR